MNSKLITHMQRIKGWRLITVVSVTIIVTVEIIVSVMSLILNGEVAGDYLLTGIVAAVLVAPASLAFLNHVLDVLAQERLSSLESHSARAERRLSAAIEAAQMVFWEYDLVNDRLTFEESELKYLGVDNADAAHDLQSWLANLHPDDREPFMQHFFITVQPGGPQFDLEYRIKQHTGNWGWIHTRGSIIQRDTDGKALWAAGGSINIDTRKSTEEKLRNSETLLRTTLESTDEGILMIARDGHVLSANKRFQELWRIPEPLMSKGQDDLLLGHVLEQLSDPSVFLDQVNRLYGSDEEARDILHFKDGRVFARFTRSLTINLEHGRIWCFKDITEQHHAENELRQSDQRFRTLFDSSPDPIWIIDEHRFVECNQAAVDMLGYPDKASLRNTHPSELSPEFQPDGESSFNKAERLMNIAQGKGINRFEWVHARKDGSEFYAEVTLSSITLQGRQVIYCVWRDISERKQIEQALRASEQKLLTILDNVDAYIYLKDAAGHYLFANRPVRELWRAGMDEIVGFGDEKFFDSATTDNIRLNDRRVLDQGETVCTEETNTVPSTGKTATYLSTKLPLRHPDGSIYALCGISTDITLRKQSEDALRASEERAQSLANLLRLIADNVPDMIWAKDLNKRYLFANKAICEQLLSANDTDEPVGKDDMFFALRERDRHPENPSWHTFGELCQDSDTLTLQQGRHAQFDEYGNVRGRFTFLDVRKAPLIDEHGEIVGVVGSARDVTAQKEAEEKLQLSSLVLGNSSEALLVTDADNRIVDVNPAFTKMTGYEPGDVIGNDPKLLQSGRQGTEFYRAMWQQIKTSGRWQGEIWNRRKNGDIYAEWMTINTIRDDDGNVHRRVALFSDITEKKRSEELIWSQANFDQLTGLPNRRMFRDRLAQDLKKAHRAGLKLALMFLDLDRFKEINDTLGHDIGDALLTEAAARITGCVRESDTVARLGGDEFTVILSELDDLSCVERIATDIINAMNRPFLLGSDTAYISASIGITLYPEDATEQEGLLKNADQAMYVAKNAGRDRFSYFTNAMQEAAQYRLYLLNDLRNALAEGQLHLYYQPIVDLQNDHIHKAEALLRWFHPKRGMISPAEFIPLAEESGLIHDIGDWVLEQAVRQAKQWRERYGADFQISVNKSPVQIQSSPDRGRWMRHLQAAELPGSNIVIEITEGLLLNSSPEVTEQLLAFRDAGIQVAIDDFGTGYSALSYLKKLDIDYVKIDQSFIRNLEHDSSDMALSEAIVMMAHKLGLKVIAEGVESAAQRDLLRTMGCDYAQGFLYARAVTALEFEQLLLKRGQTGA